nr:conjugal transfer protein TrbE [Klebsiella pneumoniae]
WDAVKGTSGSDYVESVVFILMAGFAMSVCYLFFSVLEKVINARKSKDESIYHD